MSNYPARKALLGDPENPDEDKVDKQEYLREHILDANYDKEDFALYMADLKEDGMNIDNWTLFELMGIVKEYK